MVQTTTTTKTFVPAPRPAAGLVGLGPNFEVPLQKGVALSCRGTPTSEAVGRIDADEDRSCSRKKAREKAILGALPCF